MLHLAKKYFPKFADQAWIETIFSNVYFKKAGSTDDIVLFPEHD